MSGRRGARGWRGLRKRAAALARAAGGALLAAAPLAAQPAGYVPSGTCGGWPRLPLPAAEGHCVALVAGAAQGLRFPRRLLAVGPQRWWLVDMGGWERGRGRLLELALAEGDTASARVSVLADKLDRPHGIARGPDGLVYVAEAGRIWRTPVPPPAPREAVPLPLPREPVWDGLPDDGAHPLKEIVFAPDGRLFLGLGSASDACRDERQQQPRPCPELAGALPRASVLEARLDGPGRRVGSVKVLARGLRNSLALAWDARHGVLWQGENSIDYPDADQPPEELNRLQPGQDHGWPYCVGRREPARGYPGDCRATTAPEQLWPAHAAPLQLLWQPPGAAQPGGTLIAAWHGYRPAGHRVVAFALDADGRPAKTPRLLFGGGPAVAGQPLPAPAGIAVDPGGRLLVADDRNKAVLMLVQERR